MKISEIFESFQGEGNNIGRLSLFIRVQGCPLNCVWCDTKYSITFEGGQNKSISELAKTINTFTKHKNGIVIFTGGEPLHYQDEIIEILSISEVQEVEFETSGIYLPKTELKKFKFNVSPKLKNAKLPEKIYEKIYSNLEEFKKLNTIFKFVISTPKDLEEVEQLIKNHNLQKEKIYLMPEGTSYKEILKKSKFIIPFCLKNSLNFSPRLQVLLKIK